ncbi:hypothetical protein QJS04_geneDACA022012 [Acorus gramineus]|uniref:Uncharacterized protein n=1 Tax=Acorus gramineus TaxID=55184 RepID=A0AAV9A3F7_ACOGR|nr:hypothetical protein QJS04_geneDACA022012 [Acorus gramineus]
MGGALSAASAILVPEIDVIVAFYGDPSPVKATVQAHFVDPSQTTCGDFGEYGRNRRFNGSLGEVTEEHRSDFGEYTSESRHLR